MTICTNSMLHFCELPYHCCQLVGMQSCCTSVLFTVHVDTAEADASLCGTLLQKSLTLQAMLDWHACETDKAKGTEAQVVYECQPREDMSLYLAPIGGQAADAVMTLNAQAGKLSSCWLH